jgi:hypothetical protein
VPPRRLALETAAVCGAALLLALLALRAGPWWSRGVVGTGDAWQTLWNIDHVQRALRGSEPFWSSPRVFAPEGASLRAHTLSPANTVPAALLASAAGLFTAYNTALLFTFVLAAGASYRLARRLGASPAGAALGALVFAFAPQRMARTLGHLNLLAIGWLPAALEGLLLASRGSGWRRAAGVLAGAAGLALLAFSDWYLALMGALAAASFAAFEVARTPRPRRAETALALAAAGLLALAAVFPAARALARETAGMTGHDARRAGASLTSFVVPSKVQILSRLAPSQAAREGTTAEEGGNYLGLVPLAALAAVAIGRRREREIDFALVAGAAALVLSMGPVLRIFGSPTSVPLPYALLERLVPAVRLGGAVNRFQALALLPLALGVAFAASRLLAARRRAAVFAGTLLLAAEFAPADPGHSVWPFDPPDPAMAAISLSRAPGIVLDIDPGNLDMIHQLEHGRPQVLGCLSRTPPAALSRRLADPVIGPLLDENAPASGLSSSVAAAWLRHRWNVAFVVSPGFPEFERRARALGFPEIARSDRGDQAVVFRVPEEPVAGVEGVEFHELVEDASGGRRRGIFFEGLYGGESVPWDGRAEAGCWTGPDVVLLAPLTPGDYRLRLAGPSETRPSITIRWGRREALVRPFEGVFELPLAIAPDDRGKDGMVRVKMTVAPTLREDWKGGRELGVYLISLSK